MPELLSFLALGFTFGFKHAFDADHIAAVAALSTKSVSAKHAVLRGAYWGFGHMITLLIIGLLVLTLGINLPSSWSGFFEKTVAILLLLLGIKTLRDFYVIYRGSRRPLQPRLAGIWSLPLSLAVLAINRKALSHKKILFHTHPPLGFHAHPYPSFFIGVIHGLAGSAAFLVLFVSAMKSVFLGLLYIAVFGAGSIIAMSLFTFVFGFSLRYAKNTMEVAAGIFSILAGIHIFW